MASIFYKTEYKTQLIEITEDIKEVIIKSGCKDGLVNIFTPHSTCSIFVSENQDPNLKRDILTTLNRLIPSEGYVHGNAYAHIKSAVFGTNRTIPIENASMKLGQWQGIFLGEFDGPREREVIVTLIN